MAERLRLAVHGTGRTGSAVVEVCLAAGHELVAGVVHDPAKAGADLGSLTIGRPIGVAATDDLDAVLARPDVDVLLYTGISGAVIEHVLDRCTARGRDVVTASMLDAEVALGAPGAARLAAQAARSGARVLGTGVNPGFYLDVLPAAIATTLPDPVAIRARRVTDIGHWGPNVLRSEVGLGGPPAAAPATFVAMLEASLRLLARAVDVRLDRVEREPRPLVAERRREIGGLVVEAGEVEGIDDRVRGIVDGEPLLELSWLGVGDPRGVAPGVELQLEGAGGLCVAVQMELPADPYPGTAARMVKALGPLRTLPPGVYGPQDLPLT